MVCYIGFFNEKNEGEQGQQVGLTFEEFWGVNLKVDWGLLSEPVAWVSCMLAVFEVLEFEGELIIQVLLLL